MGAFPPRFQSSSADHADRVTHMRYQELPFSSSVLGAAIALHNCRHPGNMRFGPSFFQPGTLPQSNCPTTHTTAVPGEASPSQPRPERTQSEQMSSGFLCSSAHILPSNCHLVSKMPSHQQERLDHIIWWSPRCALQDCRRKGR